MNDTVWPAAVDAAPDPERAGRWVAQFQESSAKPLLAQATSDQARLLCVLFSGSQMLSELLFQHQEWLDLCLDLKNLRHPRQPQGLQREVDDWLSPLLSTADYAAAYRRLRQLKQKEMLRIALRDLGRFSHVQEITRELSDLADICLQTVFRLCWQQLTNRFGQPYHEQDQGSWRPTPCAVFGMGKLGGQELNYSSDVDVIFVYGEEGFLFKVPPGQARPAGKGLTNHQFFCRLAEAFINEISRLTPEGFLYRIDLRLRPEGNDGPLTRSLASYENYYAQWGQTWERMMLIKARLVAGDAELGTEFLETIQPFRFPRSLGDRIIQEIAAMKRRIEKEVVKAGELDRNVKLGRGGIREIEFIVQMHQLLNAGRLPFLHEPATLPALQKLVQYNLVIPESAEELARAYTFLRDVEHRLQMENNQQTHTLPTLRSTRERLARLMHFPTLEAFEEQHAELTARVRQLYEEWVGVEEDSSTALPREVQGSEDQWREILQHHHLRDPDKAIRLIQIFVNGPGYVHVSPRTAGLALQLLEQFLNLCPTDQDLAMPATPPSNPLDPACRLPRDVLSDPDRVLARLDTFVSAYGSRSMLYELWTSSPNLFRLLLLLFDRSEFLAETAIRTPDLVDELEQSGRLNRRKSAEETLADLRHGRHDEDQRLWLRRYHQAELMRIGLREILGLADFEQNLEELAYLADACLHYALEAIMRRHQLEEPPFAIIGLGKLGGVELNYGSDLDILFVAPNHAPDLSRLQKVAAQVMEMLSSPTEFGVAFETDPRLRPDGEKGLLVNTLQAFEDYYKNRAMLWEIQSLTRIRPIAGHSATGTAFQAMAARIADFSRPRSDIAAYQPAWRQEVHRMRQRIEKERTPAGKGALAIKTGSGGLMDAEFIAQIICLSHGWQEANTLTALQRAAEAGILNRSQAGRLLPHYRSLRRIEGILRRWSYEGEILLPVEAAARSRVAIRCGYRREESLMKALETHRGTIRQVYQDFIDS